MLWQLYANKSASLDEIDKCLQRYKLPKLTQKETDALISPMFIK